MTEYNIDQESAIAAVTTHTEFDAFDLDNTKRVKKATALQIAAFSRTAAAGHNLTATSDPGAGNDNTQGYGPLSIWLNTTNSRWWICASAATGAAVWYFGGTLIGTGAEPSGLLTQFGNAALGSNFAAFAEEGNLYRNVGNPIAGNGADTTDDILTGVVIPAGAFDAAGRGLCITAQGVTGATTNNKRFKLWVNPTMSGQTTTNGVISGGTVTAGTTICDSGTWVNGTTPNNAAGWSAGANLFKYGAAGSNTQYAQGTPILGTLHGGILAPCSSL